MDVGSGERSQMTAKGPQTFDEEDVETLTALAYAAGGEAARQKDRGVITDYICVDCGKPYEQDATFTADIQRWSCPCGSSFMGVRRVADAVQIDGDAPQIDGPSEGLCRVGEAMATGGLSEVFRVTKTRTVEGGASVVVEYGGTDDLPTPTPGFPVLPPEDPDCRCGQKRFWGECPSCKKRRMDAQS